MKKNKLIRLSVTEEMKEMVPNKIYGDKGRWISMAVFLHVRGLTPEKYFEMTVGRDKLFSTQVSFHFSTRALLDEKLDWLKSQGLTTATMAELLRIAIQVQHDREVADEIPFEGEPVAVEEPATVQEDHAIDINI